METLISNQNRTRWLLLPLLLVACEPSDLISEEEGANLALGKRSYSPLIEELVEASAPRPPENRFPRAFPEASC